MSSTPTRKEVPTFDELEAVVSKLGSEQERGQAFERGVLHFLRHDPRLDLAAAWLWADWPARQRHGLAATDLGADLIAEDREGALIAVQAKYRRDPRHHLRYHDVATFLAYRQDLFPRRILVSNATSRSRNLEDASVGRTDTEWLLRPDLVDSPIDWTGALEAVSGPVEPVRVRARPRPYQENAVADVVRALEFQERAQLVMACGTGKTLVTEWIAEARGDRLVLVLVPTLLLLKQFRDVWKVHASEPFVDLAVCSDADVGRDEWRVRSDELGTPVTTDPAVIASFLRGPGRRVVFGTYASSARVAEAQDQVDVPPFDLVVADEAHRVAGITSRVATIDRDLRVVLDAGRIRARRRLFATATPRVYGPAARGRLAGREDIELNSMDDPKRFGEVAHQLWFRQAVDLGVLVDYRLTVVLVTDAEVASLIGEREAVIVDGRTYDAESLATLIALRRAIEELGLVRAISFHTTVARARGFAVALERLKLESSAPTAEHISGAMAVDERVRVLARLREPDGPTVVTNARCLTEGIDVPSLDAVAFIDPRASAVDIVQAVGRVMRRAEGKEYGHVIVPVFIGKADLVDPEAVVESTAFAPVLSVLRALRAHDPELLTDANRIAMSLGPRDAVAGGHIAAHVQLLGRAIDVRELERALELRFVDVTAEPFEVGIAHLRAYVEREGDALVPQRYMTDDGHRLGQWVAVLRKRSAYLSVERQQALEALPGWSWDPVAGAWREGLRYLRAYVDRTGHARVPAMYADDNGYRLGQWVSVQRRGRTQLSDGRKQALEAMPGWTWDPAEDAWQEGLARLHRFVEREGHARVPASHLEDGYRLGVWVSVQRNRRQRLPAERRQLLAALPGWSWDPEEDDWQEGLAHLRAYVEREGHARVPQKHAAQDGYRLGTWVSNRRASRRRGELPKHRVDVLEAMPGWTWDPAEDAWQEGLARLHRFVEREGHARVPANHVEDGFRLATWVANRRADHRRGTLPDDRASLLDILPDWSWSPIEEDWQDGVARLRRFVERQGHARVPQYHVMDDGYRLGIWVSVQRSRASKGKLGHERVAFLQSLPGWSWNAAEDAWQEALTHLRRFVKREGHARVPTKHLEDGFRLGQWVSGLRNRRPRIPSERRQLLEALPGWSWDPGEDDWQEGFGHLRTYVEREGHARVSTKYVTLHGYRLGRWVSTQRRHHASLADERRQLFETFPGWSWDPFEDDWQEGLAHLHRFLEREGHVRVPSGHIEDGYRLGQWVSVQRHHGLRLVAERRQLLEALPGWTWNRLEENWQEGLAHLHRFVEREGHARVVKGHVTGDGYRLGTWVRNRRADHRNGKLPEDRTAALEALPSWSWSMQRIPRG